MLEDIEIMIIVNPSLTESIFNNLCVYRRDIVRPDPVGVQLLC